MVQRKVEHPRNSRDLLSVVFFFFPWWLKVRVVFLLSSASRLHHDHLLANQAEGDSFLIFSVTFNDSITLHHYISLSLGRSFEWNHFAFLKVLLETYCRPTSVVVLVFLITVSALANQKSSTTPSPHSPESHPPHTAPCRLQEPERETETDTCLSWPGTDTVQSGLYCCGLFSLMSPLLRWKIKIARLFTPVGSVTVWIAWNSIFSWSGPKPFLSLHFAFNQKRGKASTMATVLLMQHEMGSLPIKSFHFLHRPFGVFKTEFMCLCLCWLRRKVRTRKVALSCITNSGREDGSIFSSTYDFSF